ncbi:hypothetical protein ACQUSR_20300 [Streptomyces sp. P1-3]|uniref:hypothetical protein n=1 Tax=Streptomyces sp. P1-3 TaxID=3421658 RepID=UPI003D36E993
MSTTQTSRYVRIRVDLMLEVSDSGALTKAALDHIGGDDFMPDEERGYAQDAVRDDEAEALAYLIDPFSLIEGVPGVELAKASWTSEGAAYDPDADDWDMDDDV